MSEHMVTPGPGTVTTEIERRIGLAVRRSRMFQVLTGILAVAWVCVVVAVASHIRREQQLQAEEIRVEEQRRLADQLKRNEQEAQRLKQQAQNARLASNYVASGVFKATHGDGNGALADYKKALSYDPDNPAALSYEGYLRLRLGQPEKAEELLGRSVELDPNIVWNHYNFALALWANGKHEQAISQVADVVKLDPALKNTIANDYQFHEFRADPTFRELIKP